MAQIASHFARLYLLHFPKIASATRNKEAKYTEVSISGTSSADFFTLGQCPCAHVDMFSMLYSDNSKCGQNMYNAAPIRPVCAMHIMLLLLFFSFDDLMSLTIYLFSKRTLSIAERQAASTWLGRQANFFLIQMFRITFARTSFSSELCKRLVQRQ